MPKVSVIVPNYNHSLFLKARIESILNQTFQNFEMIILDDFSTDDSIKIIETYRIHPKVTSIIYNKKNSGSTFKQWEKGINLAKGEYIWIAESDDWCEPNFLEELIKLHTSNPDVGLAYCKSFPIDSENKITDFNDGWLRRVDDKRWDSDFFNDGVNECEKYLSVQCTIPNASAVLFSKKALETVDIAKITYEVCGDWKIYVSILEKFNIAYTLKTINYHRGHGTNARSLYGGLVIYEQVDIMVWMKRKFAIKKFEKYQKSLDEKLNVILTLMRASKISFKNAFSMFFKMIKLDYFIFFRALKVAIFKILKINVGFNQK